MGGHYRGREGEREGGRGREKRAGSKGLDGGNNTFYQLVKSPRTGPPPPRKSAAQNFSDPLSAPLTGMSDEAEIQT